MVSEQTLVLQDAIERLPPKPPSTIRQRPQDQAGQPHPGLPILVVLDDDPTGTQTCHDVIVLTVWDVPSLANELMKTPSDGGFFILTNSRALHPGPAKRLIIQICQNLQAAGRETKIEFEVMLRGDSTLRGHFPLEPEAVEEVLGVADAWILCPFYLQGGRYTIDDVHYVAEGTALVPAHRTPFAEDATFGYKSSNLREWVVEKSAGRISTDRIVSLSLDLIRAGGADQVFEKLVNLDKGSVVIVNAAAEEDLDVVVNAVRRATGERGKRYLYRTGAAFVSARLSILPIPPFSWHQLRDTKTRTVGLTIAGSYVPKTTSQLEVLQSRIRDDRLVVIQLDVTKLVAHAAEKEIQPAIAQAERALLEGQDVLVMTSRNLIVGADETESLTIGSRVAEALVTFLRDLKTKPRYLIAKGGITASDMSTKALQMRRATIVGQAAPGVPLWKCDEATSKWSGLPYVVFPGNVGSNETLADLVQAWSE